MSKNYTAVDEYYKENQKYEFLICHFKNTTLTNNTKYELRENIRKN